MSDDPKLRNAPDDKRISIDQEHEVHYWTEAFGVSRAELEEAVRSVGNSVERVRQHLKRGGGRK
jgi:hypothetical protein